MGSLVAAAGVLCARAELANGLRAVVNESVVTDFQIRMSTAQAVELLQRQYATRPLELERKYKETVENALDQLVERRLIIDDFNTSGFTLPEKFIDEAVSDRIRHDFGDRATLVKTLQAQGVTVEKMRQQIRERIMFEALRDKNISVAVFISPREIQNYYLAHTNDFSVEETVRLRMIVVDSSTAPDAGGRRKMADEILAKIKGGASFTEMASVYSSGSQKREGGDWGWVKKSVLRTELADVAFSISTNQPSNVIETPETCYIMKVEEKRPAHVSPLPEVQEEIEKTLLVQERAFYQKRYVDRLRKKTFVRYF